MSSKKYWIALSLFAVVVSVSAVALGRHHRPFQRHSPAAARHAARALDLPAGVPIETS
jgi:hypothetical protein